MKPRLFVGLAAAVFVVGSVVFLPATAVAAGFGPGLGGACYDVGGYRLFLECSGTGEPTVLLDAGLGGDHAEWSAVQPGVAQFSRVCSWDRAGLGRSDPRPQRGPVTTQRVVTELHTLLQQAGVAGPYVLVGHSIGGIDVRLYQQRYPAQVVGLVMAEATPEQQYLTGAPVDRNGGEVMQLWPGARALERSSLPPDLPLVVIERAKHTDPVWQAQQAALSVRSANSLIVAERSDHGVQKQQPGLVVAAIQTVIDAARDRTSLDPCPTAVVRAEGLCLPPGTAPALQGIIVKVWMLVAVGCVLLLFGTGMGMIARGRVLTRRRSRSA